MAGLASLCLMRNNLSVQQAVYATNLPFVIDSSIEVEPMAALGHEFNLPARPPPLTLTLSET